MREERDRIHALGLGRVVGTWLDEESSNPTQAMKREYASRDRYEVTQADLLIVDTLDENNRGGREVEVGIALGRCIEVWVVGPKRNVFHELACHFDSWNEALKALAKEAADARYAASALMGGA